MSNLPDSVRLAWDTQRVGPCSLATVAADGTPNVVYVGTVSLCDEGFIIANYHFHKTKANLSANAQAALLFFTGETSYQIKGTISFHHDGPVLEAMQAAAQAQGKPHVSIAALLSVDSVFNGIHQLAAAEALSH